MSFPYPGPSEALGGITKMHQTPLGYNQLFDGRQWTLGRLRDALGDVIMQVGEGHIHTRKRP